MKRNLKKMILAISVALAGCNTAVAPLQPAANSAAMPASLPGWHWAGMPYGCGPALAVGPKGETVVTSDVVPTLWRIDPVSRAVSAHPLELDADTDKDVGFSSISWSARHGAYFAVSHDHSSLWRIDPLLRRAQKTQLSAQLPKGCGASWEFHLSPDQRSAFVPQAQSNR